MPDDRGPFPLTTFIVKMLALPADKLVGLNVSKMADRWGLSVETVEHWVGVRRSMVGGLLL